jgi:chitinase
VYYDDPSTTSSSSSSVYYYDDPSTTSSSSSSSVYYYDDPSTTSSSSSVYYYDDPSTTSSSSSVYYYDDPSSSTPVKPTVTSKPYYSYDDPSYTSTSVYTTTITTTYVDVCPTGLTTVTATYKTTVCPGSTTPAVPDGWSTTVTVCKNCGPKPTTITITKPYAASTAVEIVTLVVKPVPENEYYSSMSTVVVPSVPAAPVKAAPSYPVAPVAASSYPIVPVASSSSVSPVKPITYAAASGYAAPTGSKTGYPAAQFTGAASRVNVGVGAFVGLIIAAVAAM